MGGVIASHNRNNDRSYKNIVDQYGKRCQWLKNEKFLKDLEGDSVDTEILDEELRILQDEEPQTCRGKTAKVMETSPVQIALCILILVDAGIVITEILLDLHAMRSQQREAAAALHQTLDFLRYQYADDLSGYQGDNVQYILEKLRRKYKNASADGKTRTKRSLAAVLCFDDVTSFASSHRAPRRGGRRLGLSDPLRKQRLRYYANGLHEPHRYFYVNGVLSNGKFRNAIRSRRYVYVPYYLNEAGVVDRTLLKTETPPRITRSKRDVVQTQLPEKDAPETDPQPGLDEATGATTASKLTSTGVRSYHSSPELPHDGVTEEVAPGASGSLGDEDDAEALVVDSHGGRGSTAMYSENAHAKKLLKIAHILHYASIAILGVFVLQVFLKLFGMGAEFFKSKLELFDGIIIIASFALDLVFVEGIGGAEGEEAIALLIIFLLWRILRVINGIMVTTKQRHEFRIKLQRRACRRAEKKIESLEEDISWKDKEVHTLKALCLRNGATEGDIEAAQPKRRPLFSKMNTSSGLSSIASLSLGFTMSMRPMPPAKAGAGTVTHGALPPSSSSSSSSETVSRGQQSTEESQGPLRRTGTWCADHRPVNGDETKPRGGSSATQSLHMKRITEELTTAAPGGNTGTANSIGSDDINRCRSNSAADGGDDGDEKTGNCSSSVPPAPLPLEQSNDFDLEANPSKSIVNNSGQAHETAAPKLPNSVPRPEAASPQRDHRSDPPPEALQPSGMDSATEQRLGLEPRIEIPGNINGNQSTKHPSSQPPPTPCTLSVDGAVRWFRWRSPSKSQCSCSSCSCSSRSSSARATPPAPKDTSPHSLLQETTHASTVAASKRRSAWKNTFQRKRNEATPPSANV